MSGRGNDYLQNLPLKKSLKGSWILYSNLKNGQALKIRSKAHVLIFAFITKVERRHSVVWHSNRAAIKAKLNWFMVRNQYLIRGFCSAHINFLKCINCYWIAQGKIDTMICSASFCIRANHVQWKLWQTFCCKASFTTRSCRRTNRWYTTGFNWDKRCFCL